MDLIKKKLNEITPYEFNAKEHPREQIEQIKKSIEEFGNNDPIAVDENGVIIEGHGRLMALKELGAKEADVIVLKGLTEEQKNAYRLVHNKLTMNSDFDLRVLEQELEKIKDYDMEALGFNFEEIAEGLTKLEDENATLEEDDFNEEEALEEIEEPITKPGDIWVLGDHRLLCGDSTKEEDVRKVVEAVTEGGTSMVDLVVTDPPYNVAYEGGTDEKLKIENDNMETAAFFAFLRDAFKAMNAVMRPGAAFYIWHASRTSKEFIEALEANNLEIRQQLIWVKNVFTLGRQDYQWQHEPCFYGWKDGAAHYFKDSRLETTVIEDAPNVNKMSKEELKDYVKQLLKDRPASTIIREDKPTRNEDHPTMKPVKLFGYLIQNSSKRGEVVLDPFSGSGTTVIACEQLGRKAAAIELDPVYCDVIVKRWEEYTGKKAVKL